MNLKNALTFENAESLLLSLRLNRRCTVSKESHGWDYDQLAYMIRDVVLALGFRVTNEEGDGFVTLYIEGELA